MKKELETMIQMENYKKERLEKSSLQKVEELKETIVNGTMIDIVTFADVKIEKIKENYKEIEIISEQLLKLNHLLNKINEKEKEKEKETFSILENYMNESAHDWKVTNVGKGDNRVYYEIAEIDPSGKESEHYTLYVKDGILYDENERKIDK